MRKVFIDCGGHNGCSVRKFRKDIDKKNEFEIYSFEPNIVLYEKNKEKNIVKYNKAVGNRNEYVDFYIHERDTFASTTSTEKGTMPNCGSPKKGNVSVSKVEMVDLDHFIKSNFSKDDLIYLKLDIEGEEYNLMPYLLEKDTFSYIDKLFIEWHSRWIGKEKSIDEHYELQIKKNNVIIDNTWDAARF